MLLMIESIKTEKPRNMYYEPPFCSLPLNGTDSCSAVVYKTINHVSFSQFINNVDLIAIDHVTAYFGLFGGDVWLRSEINHRGVTKILNH